MTYEATYESGDMDDIVMDIIGSSAVQFMSFISIIVLLILVIWMAKKLKGLRK